MDESLVGSGYADHLTDADLALLTSVAGTGIDPARAAGQVSRLRRNPVALPELIGDARVFEAVFGDRAGTQKQQPLLASPFLAFAVAVHRAATELASMVHVPELSAPRRRVPLFDASDLRDFLASPARKLFLAEFLASFTRIASGQYRDRTGRRPRARLLSELDPVRLAALLDEAGETERAGVFRRLGDVALFLTGVFPDYAASQAFGPVSVARLLHAARLPSGQDERLADAPPIELLEQLGARWYRAAWVLAPVRTARLAVVAEVSDRFRQARRVLNHIADRYLFSSGNPWFAPPPM
jgi:hypothetical protein